MTGALPSCLLCGRPLGRRIEYHHPIPKSRGGRVTVPLHPICHQAIHAAIDNRALERLGGDMATLRSHPDLARFIAWVKGKPADFHAPTHGGRRRRR